MSARPARPSRLGRAWLAVLLAGAAGIAHAQAGPADAAPGCSPVAASGARAAVRAPAPAIPFVSRMIGGVFEHEARPGESLSMIGSRHGAPGRLIARDSGLKAGAPLKPGTVLVVDNRHLVPDDLTEGIVINAPQRMLYLFSDGELRAAHPVALGRPDWPTPLGPFKVANMAKDKPWIVPPSIQEEMRQAGKPVLTRVEPGPDNPLGRFWIGLSRDNLGIHGTIAPTSIYEFRSHGCIRLHPDDVELLFEKVEVGTPGRIVYHPVLLGRTEDGRIWLEAHRDVYRRAPAPLPRVRDAADRAGLTERIDWDKVGRVLRAADGIAREVGLPVLADSPDNPSPMRTTYR